MYSKSTSVDNSPREVTQTGISPWIRKQLGNLIRKKKEKRRIKNSLERRGCVQVTSFFLPSFLGWGVIVSLLYIFLFQEDVSYLPFHLYSACVM